MRLFLQCSLPAKYVSRVRASFPCVVCNKIGKAITCVPDDEHARQIHLHIEVMSDIMEERNNVLSGLSL